MKMEVVDLEEDVLNVVAEEASVIVDVLCRESNVLEKIYPLVEPSIQEELRGLPSLRERVVAIVDYFKDSDPHKCCQFLEKMWMFCQSIPLDLEIKVLSVAGASPGGELNNCSDTEPHNAKRICLDQVQSYINSLKLLLQQKFERVTKDVVCLDKAWLRLRQRNSTRGRDKNAQAQEGEDSLEHKESVEALLKTTGRVVVLLGLAGSGKTVLMHCLAHHWIQGSYPSIKLLFLLEFRQLNLVSQPLSLKELLFRFFLLPGEGEEQSEAVFSYILSNPEEICFIFDGYDEFAAKVTDPEKLGSPLDPYQRLPMADLLSGLCSYKILPKCTVLVTCRPRDVTDLFGSSGFFVAELLGFSPQRVKEYTEEYFNEKGSELKERAVTLLMGNRHLLSMSHVPALCHICCICLDHLLSRNTSQSPVELPKSLTQIYLHILSAFLSRCHSNSKDSMPLLQRYRTQISELSRLAMTGLEKSHIVFVAQNLSTELMNFGANAGILSRVDLTCADGSRGLGCAFNHLTMQEFLSALHLMTSPDISEAQLKSKLNLKSRWTAKSDPKTVFTDSLHLFMCGLAAEACTSSLGLLVGGEDAVAVVQKRQAAVLKILRSFVGTASQTGPKVVELCRCIHETQDVSLAKVVGSRARFELRNITLNPLDMDALAFVTSSVDQMLCLDFGGCSIELECLSIFPSCGNLERLVFRSRKYDDRFAEALSSVLPELGSLKQLDFISGGLTDIGADKLVKALERCPQITHLNVSDNSLSDESVRKIADLSLKLANIRSVMLGKNKISRKGIFILVEKMAAVLKIRKVHVRGKNDICVSFSPNSHTPSVSTDECKDTEAPNELIFSNYNLKETHMASLCSKLRDCSSLTILDLSKNSLGNNGLRKLLNLLSRHGSIQEINVSDNKVDMDGVVQLSASLCTQKSLREVDASHNGNQKLILKFSDSRRDAVKPLSTDGLHQHKKFSLTQSEIQSTDMSRLCKNLINCKQLMELDFSYGILNDESVEELQVLLPDMKSLQLLNLSQVQMSTNGALLLMRLLTRCQRITVLELRPQGEAFIKFLQVRAKSTRCRFTQYKLTSDDVKNLSRTLETIRHFPYVADLDLSSNFLRDEGVKSFIDFLPRLKITNSVSLNNNDLTQLGVLSLVNSLSTCERVVSVEVSGEADERALIRFSPDTVVGKSLCLNKCSFEAEHWQRFLEVLRRCPSKLKLELSSNVLLSQNILLNSLARLSSIQTLKLKNNGLNAEAIKHLVTQLSTDNDCKTLRIEESWIKGEAAVCLVSSCLDLNSHIKEIKVGKSFLNISVEFFHSSRVASENGDFSQSAVRSISFDDCEVDGQHLSSLQTTVQKCLSLLELHFSQVTMGTAGAEFLLSVLPSLENLQSLSLKSKGEKADEAVIFALQHIHQHLESLSLSYHVISDSGAAELGKVLQTLIHMRSLNLSHCSGWTAAGGHKLVRGLIECLALEELQLDCVELDEESTVCLTQGLRNMTSLKKISLNKMVLISKDGSGVLCLLASLEALRGLEEIELERLRMGDRGIEKLVKYIPKWTSLRKINLSENCVSDHAGEMLVKALSHCRALQQLHLFRNKLSHGFAARLAQILPSLSQLSEIDLSENLLGTKGSISLCEGLISLKALKKLSLTSIGTTDLVSVVTCLKHCSSIESLSLAWNKCGNDVAVKLAEVLPQCSKLKILDLEANNINKTGAKALAKCLQSCPWIEVIRLWRNPIEKDDQILGEQRLNFSST